MKKRVLILGMDGYLGWSLAVHLAEKGYEIAGIDSGLRRSMVTEMMSESVTPIKSMDERLGLLRELAGQTIPYYEFNIVHSYKALCMMLDLFRPEAIVHFAEQPSAPYSMIDAYHAKMTHDNNLGGTINLLFAMRDHAPEAHLVKLGTMGEYGTPNLDIPEGMFEIEYRGRKDTLPFPRQPGSFYHQTKVHDSSNILMACRQWGLRSTDIMQGVVYGLAVNDWMMQFSSLTTRFDVDECFGTAINRFCAQAVVGEDITPFGKGWQRRGFLPIQDSMQCLTLAIDSPPEHGEYRTFNQFEEVYTINGLAEKVVEQANKLWDENPIKANIKNPRIEAEDHYYNPDHKHLLDLGYKPTSDIDTEISKLLVTLQEHRRRIEMCKHRMQPTITWKEGGK